uniref:Tr-type G domain-containing protein n=1 Tax=Ditylenchus dipsaci TaxID=166011 RepID=A0A915DL08_9BILA
MSEVCCATYNKTRKKFKKELHFKEKSTKEAVEIYSDMTLSELSNSLGEDVNEVAKMMKKCTVAQIETDQLIKLRWPAAKEEKHFDDLYPQPPAPPEECQPRAPVVTIMGHEFENCGSGIWGITQHIGAFSVTLPANRSKVTFLDTPGHAAFKAMRERGARSTDIVVLVVAADDGVNEQTVESIRYAKEANVPIVVAINKCDKTTANPTKTRHDLMEYDVIVEDIGGDVQVVEISALRGTNLDRLQEALVFQAELMDLKATPKGPVEGVVIESTNVHGIGKACTMIVNRGTLRKGCLLVAGPVYGHVKTMHDEFNRVIDEAGPSCPVRITGWKNDLPPPGELVLESSRHNKLQNIVEGSS